MNTNEIRHSPIIVQSPNYLQNPFVTREKNAIRNEAFAAAVNKWPNAYMAENVARDASLQANQLAYARRGFLSGTARGTG
ncbi:hypothetical protein R1flu_026321 [Riccia fluitans]|uniref:Uncharacterized protein n=1 Tax=Riccia fluitans TaxID=41844 RepID=A0ABD1XFM2_9MARC